jgi:hypothetical protein
MIPAAAERVGNALGHEVGGIGVSAMFGDGVP